MSATLVIIDPTVSNYQSLVDGLLPEAETIILNPKRDGIEQISESLEANSNISSLHIISHGKSGSLQYIMLFNYLHEFEPAKGWQVSRKSSFFANIALTLCGQSRPSTRTQTPELVRARR
jgi:hypothetical protein